MKHWNIKSFLAGGLVTALIMGLSVPTLAKTVKTVELYYNNIQIRLNGKSIIPKDAKGNTVDPFIINGTTYVPVRAIGEAFGLNVKYDGATNTVILGNDPKKGQPAKWLGELEPFTGDADENIVTDQQYDETFTANNGDTFDRYLYIDNGGVSYLLKGQYSKFTGTLYMAQKTKNAMRQTRLVIYADDTLVYTSPTLTAGVEPASFNVDVSNCYELKLVIQIDNEGDTWQDWTSDLSASGGDVYKYPCSLIGNAALWTD